MKILTLTKFYHPYRGGIETVSKNITDSNIEAGHQSDVLCSNTNFQFADEVDQKVKIHRSPKLITLKSTSICPFMPWQLRNLIPNYDLIHVHFPDPMTALSIFLVKPSIPFVVHWHSDIVKQKSLMTLYGPLQRWCLENAKFIIVTSENYANHSEDLEPFKHKIKIVPIGIDSLNLPLERRLKEQKNILSVGRLIYYKGYETLIEAARFLPETYVFKIVGNGELREELQEKIDQFGLSKRVKLLGQTTDLELKAEYENSELFCFPSNQKTEAFGVVLLEAMSNSLPIVACNIEGSGVPWVNQQGLSGLNVNPNSPEELAGAIQKILESPELYSKYSIGSFQRFRDEFRLEKMMKKIWDVYFDMTHTAQVGYSPKQR